MSNFGTLSAAFTGKYRHWKTGDLNAGWSTSDFCQTVIAGKTWRR